ncbi:MULTISPECIES: ORF6N domain-containing protein [unclassified Fibrobacter]|uniref:ORF6N domain-containing protein n=1 Tax=unclassified Fibrobacter TaxID=2634177 RepID=UPI000910E3FD|nr:MULTISPECIES: ORF6N domain-containing protein [unclassified Fibrobacter]OWV05682.1 DNA-binding protein [Fibrobacter sp. UWH3]SHK13340.1 ORF6N domain-containing protein [Fibrobacter sp. UWH6]
MKKKEVLVAGNSAVPANVAEKTKEIVLIDENLLKNKVYTIRGVKVMLDADLAEIYGYSVKAFNQQVKNNAEKFPEDFRFQVSEKEVDALSRSNFLTSMQAKGIKGGRTYRPYAFTEQGIYMLMTVLKGELATKQSIAIVRLFKDMKDYIASENQQLLGCSNCVQIAALTVQNSKDIAEIRSDFNFFKNETQESLGKVMEFFHDPSTYKHHLILNGQKLEADVAYTQIYGMAQKLIFVFDDYVGVKTLDLLRGVAQNLKVTIFSDQRSGCVLTDSMLADFNATRPDVAIELRSAGGIFHDRYIVLDYGTEKEKMFHCGASSKDAGGKITTIMEIENPEVYRELMEALFNS